MTKKLRVYLAQLNATGGDIEGNINLLREARGKANQEKSDIIIVATPHKSYKKLKISKNKVLVDIWGIFEKK